MLILATILLLFVAACGFNDDDEQDASTDESDTEAEAPEADEDEEEEEESEGTDGAASGVVNLQTSAEIPTADSSHAHDSAGFTTLNNTNEGLYRSDENHIPQLAIAEEHETNDDETVHTFTIRDAEWANGEPVTAHDFEYAWKRTFEVAGHYSDMFVTANVKNAQAVLDEEMSPDELGVEALDEQTLEVTLEGPSPLFKNLLTFPTFFPLNEEFVEEHGESFGTEADKVLENGPYILDSWHHDQGWTFKKNDNYWDADNVQMEEINMEIVKETSTAVNLWETGELDYITLSSSYVDEYENDESFYIDEQASIVFMRVNHNMEEFQNENIRKAIDMSLDKDGLTDVILNDGSVPLNSLIPYKFSYSPDEEKDFRDINGDFNEGSKEEAQELWEQGLDEVGIDGFEVSLTASDAEAHEKAAEYVKDQLETNLEGLTVEIDKVPFEARLEKEKAVEYDMVISTWGPDFNDPMTFLDMWITGGSANRMDFSDEDYDNIIDEARDEVDELKRYDLLLEAENMLMDEMHIIPLFQDADAILKRTNIKNMIRHPSAPQYDYKLMSVE